MFIRSRFDYSPNKKAVVNSIEYRLMTHSVIRIDTVESISKFELNDDRCEYGIIFDLIADKPPHTWRYDNIKDRDEEFEWIMKQIGCVRNKGSKIDLAIQADGRIEIIEY